MTRPCETSLHPSPRLEQYCPHHQFWWARAVEPFPSLPRLSLPPRSSSCASLLPVTTSSSVLRLQAALDDQHAFVSPLTATPRTRAPCCGLGGGARVVRGGVFVQHRQHPTPVREPHRPDHGLRRSGSLQPAYHPVRSFAPPKRHRGASYNERPFQYVDVCRLSVALPGELAVRRSGELPFVSSLLRLVFGIRGEGSLCGHMADGRCCDWAGDPEVLRGTHGCESIHSTLSSWGTKFGAHRSKLGMKWLIGRDLATMTLKLWIHLVERQGPILDWSQSCQPEPVLSFGVFAIIAGSWVSTAPAPVRSTPRPLSPAALAPHMSSS